jgi:hypothetical protein
MLPPGRFQARDYAKLNWINSGRDDNWDGRSGDLRRKCRTACGGRDDHGYLTADEIIGH